MPHRHATEKPCVLILGASKGLGLEIAKETVRRSMIAVCVSRSQPDTFAWADKDRVWRQADIADPAAAFDILKLHREFPITHVFWVAGIHRKGPIRDANYEDVGVMTRTHFTGPVNILRACFRNAWRSPIHLVTVASTSSYRMRENETLYCALKAAKAHFTRNFAAELARDLPGSRTLLVNPGGMRTDFLKGFADVSNWMDPAVVAKIIWDRVAAQTKIFEEINLLRQPDGSAKVVEGPQTPETP